MYEFCRSGKRNDIRKKLDEVMATPNKKIELISKNDAKNYIFIAKLIIEEGKNSVADNRLKELLNTIIELYEALDNKIDSLPTITLKLKGGDDTNDQ